MITGDAAGETPASPRLRASCRPAAISAIAGVPTREAVAVIRRLFDRPAVNGVHIDELTTPLEEFGWAPQYAQLYPKYRKRRHPRREAVWDRIFADIPFEVRAITLGTFLDPGPGQHRLPARSSGVE